MRGDETWDMSGNNWECGSRGTANVEYLTWSHSYSEIILFFDMFLMY